MQIESGLYHRQGKAQNNFAHTLPSLQSDLAQQLLKDPYNFDFLTLSREAHERDLETALVTQIRKFLLELGVGFSFVGSQYPLEVGGQDFRIDLLFYHLNLRCFVVIDLKMGAFQPEDTGKMNFYLSAVDDLLRIPTTSPLSVWFSVGRRTALSPNTLYAISQSHSASRNSATWNNYPRS